MTSERQAQRHVTVEGVRLRFAAAHMATLGDDLEPLHGHNYEASCRVEGALTSDQWVIDFAALKGIVRAVCERLDHHFLLQAASPLLTIGNEAGSWVLEHHQRRYVIPEADVVALPIANTTAELLAEWMWEEIRAALEAGGHTNVMRLALDLAEMPGQTGGYAADLRPSKAP
jgi:6-pyruvoyltetrahydropterin/6-carboxytetrahydropterin synthase